MAAHDNWFLRNLGKTFLRVIGWHTEQGPPDIPKMVCIIAPHTSNWDFIICVMGSFALRAYGSWIAKHTLFVGPFDPLLRWIGGLPVDRSRGNNLVDQVVSEFNRRERMLFVLTPEGTRHRTEYWHSGFYEIAMQAGAAIVMCYPDYKRKACGFGPAIWPTGDREGDMAKIRAFYETVTAKYPELVGPMRLRPTHGERA